MFVLDLLFLVFESSYKKISYFLQSFLVWFYSFRLMALFSYFGVFFLQGTTVSISGSPSLYFSLHFHISFVISLRMMVLFLFSRIGFRCRIPSILLYLLILLCIASNASCVVYDCAPSKRLNRSAIVLSRVFLSLEARLILNMVFMLRYAETEFAILPIYTKIYVDDAWI